MRKLGLIGGMSWASTELYYRHLNKSVNKARGGLTSAPLLIESLDFSTVARARSEEDWARVTEILIASAQRLEAAGAGAIMIAANSMHRVAREVEAAIGVPLLHIAEAVGKALKADKVGCVAIVGTANVMAEGWYRRRLMRYGVKLVAPRDDRVEEIERIIYDELMRGKVTRDSERTMKTFLTNYDQENVDAVVLASTELRMIVDPKANVLPIYDSTELHIAMGAEWILRKK